MCGGLGQGYRQDHGGVEQPGQKPHRPAEHPIADDPRGHRAEQAELIEDALTLGKTALKRIAARKAEYKGKGRPKAKAAQAGAK